MTEDRPYRRANSVEEAAGGAGRGRCRPAGSGDGRGGDRGGRRPRPRTAWPNDLTDREVDVLRLAARGLSNKEIASSLVISPRTAQNHLAAIYDKTDRRTRAGAAVFAVEHGLI